MTEVRGGRGSVLLIAEQLRRSVAGGIGTSIRGLLHGLGQLEDGPAVTLAASRVGGPDPLAELGYPLRAWTLPGPLLTRAWSLGACRTPGGFDVVHAPSFAAPPVRPRRGVRPPLVMTVHDLAWRQYPEATTARGRRWHEAALRRALERVDAFVVPSGPVGAELTAAGAREDRVTVIPWGSDHLAPADDEAASAVLGRAGVTGEFLLCMETREPRKNLARLLAAYARALEEGLGSYPLVVAGPLGWGDPSIPAEAPPGVVLLGPVGEGVKTALYRRARAFVSVPLLEGFGLPALEAMACGSPLLVSATVPSVSLADGARERAVIVDPLDVQEIAQGLVAVCQGPGREGRAERALAYARSLTWAAAAARHCALWDSLR
jgi:glycosyltransferase involved in cell wall biosynthesis